MKVVIVSSVVYGDKLLEVGSSVDLPAEIADELVACGAAEVPAKTEPEPKSKAKAKD